MFGLQFWKIGVNLRKRKWKKNPPPSSRNNPELFQHCHPVCRHIYDQPSHQIHPQLEALLGLRRTAQMMAARLRKPNVSSAAEGKSAVLSSRSVLTVCVCWTGLILIMALRIYFTFKSSETSDKLTAENRDLMERLDQLRRENQELKAEKRSLTEKSLEVEKASHELNMSRVQWSIDQYCYKEGRWCQSCQKDWEHYQSQCYAVNDPQVENRKTWEEAREDCRGKFSDLVMMNNDGEKWTVATLTWNMGTDEGLWIGLRVMNGTWKWVDGTEVTESSWNEAPVEGQCVISVRLMQWESVSCNRAMRWICEKKSLSL